jgi:hypothetical protein
MFERFEWIQTPDGTYILIDTWTGKVVENSPTYRTTSISSTEDIKK